MDAKKERINFYFEYLEHGEFSNYYASPITMKGKVWPTVEHYYQAQKHRGRTNA